MVTLVAVVAVVALGATSAIAGPRKARARAPIAPVATVAPSTTVAPVATGAAPLGHQPGVPSTRAITLPTGRPDLWDSYVAAQKDHADRGAHAIAAEYGFRSVSEMQTWEQQAQAEARESTGRTGQGIIALITDAKKARISSDYGIRVDPLSDGLGTHAGVDISAPYGASIFVVADGRVTFASYNGGNGFMVEVQHADGTKTRYCHASSILVDKGALVTAGQKIALVGSTGRSTGAHVHFEARRNGIPMNPHKFVRTLETRVAVR